MNILNYCTSDAIHALVKDYDRGFEIELFEEAGELWVTVEVDGERVDEGKVRLSDQ